MKGERRLWPDVLPVVLLSAAGVAATQDSSSGGGALVDSLLVPLITVPVFWWRRAPLWAAAGLLAGVVIAGIPSSAIHCGFAFPGGFLIAFSLGQRDGLRRSLLGLAVIEAGIVFLVVTELDLGAAFIPLLAAGVWGAGRLYGSRTRVAAELSDRTRDLQQTREESAQLAAEIERARVAADLDLAARDRIRAVVQMAREGEEGSDGAPEDFERIEREGRESLNQMRELLGVLRSDERDTSPRPTLAQLETLLERARAGGRQVELRVDGHRRPLPSGVELAAYRVIQHALEAFGVGSGEQATVSLRYRDSDLELEVFGGTPEARLEETALEAARERVAAHGGAFDAIPRSGGGMLVRAELPLAVPSG